MRYKYTCLFLARGKGCAAVRCGLEQHMNKNVAMYLASFLQLIALLCVPADQECVAHKGFRI